MEKQRTYIAIDLKSFYASVECVERHLDPLKTNLVVADPSRTEKTICLAVSPSLKAYGIPGRARLFEVVEAVKDINAKRKASAPGRRFRAQSVFADELANDNALALDYIVAPPQMAYYMKYSTQIYNIYLKYVAAEDIHVYSIDEVFMDVTDYLKSYGMTARELTVKIIHDVLDQTGITATAGIGTNLYLCKIAMDVEAKHVQADKDGVRIAELDEMSYRKKLWEHEPLTDFWRVGKGIAKKLNERGIYTMGDIARCSIAGPSAVYNEETLYKLFGVNAELLIDHAWGWEPCLIKDIKEYKPETKSLSQGQVLSRPYTYNEALLVVKEMADDLSMDLLRKGLLSDQLVLTICYDVTNIYNGAECEIEDDWYGRPAPKNAHGTIHLNELTASTNAIMNAAAQLYEEITDKRLLIRRIYIFAANAKTKNSREANEKQISIFDNEPDEKQSEDDLKIQEAILGIHNRYGKNALLKGHDLEESATAKLRHGQIGGHKA